MHLLLAIAATGLIWSRYSVVIYPVNYNLLAVNAFMAFTGLYQLYRKAKYCERLSHRLSHVMVAGRTMPQQQKLRRHECRASLKKTISAARHAKACQGVLFWNFVCYAKNVLIVPFIDARRRVVAICHALRGSCRQCWVFMAHSTVPSTKRCSLGSSVLAASLDGRRCDDGDGMAAHHKCPRRCTCPDRVSCPTESTTTLLKRSSQQRPREFQWWFRRPISRRQHSAMDSGCRKGISIWAL